MGSGSSNDSGARGTPATAVSLAEDEVYYNYNSATALRPAAFVNGKPTVEADEAVGCFSTTNERGELLTPPGLLYRLVCDAERQWHFYNDTRDLNMVVTGYFGAVNRIKALGATRMWREMPSGLLVLELVVRPLETAAYLEGTVNDGYDLRFKALPAAAPLPAGVAAGTATTTTAAAAPRDSKNSGSDAGKKKKRGFSFRGRDHTEAAAGGGGGGGKSRDASKSRSRSSEADEVFAAGDAVAAERRRRERIHSYQATTEL